MIELLRVRLFRMNGTKTEKVIRQRTVRLFAAVSEAEKYRRELRARFEKRHPGETIEVLLDTRSKEGEIIR